MRIVKKLKIVKELVKAECDLAEYRIHGGCKCTQLHALHVKFNGSSPNNWWETWESIPCSKNQGKSNNSCYRKYMIQPLISYLQERRKVLNWKRRATGKSPLKTVEGNRHTFSTPGERARMHAVLRAIATGGADHTLKTQGKNGCLRLKLTKSNW